MKTACLCLSLGLELAATGVARAQRTTERVSVDSSGVEGDDGSFQASISADGRFVAFRSHSTNLVPGDSNGRPDVFVHDRQTGSTERVSVDSAGTQGNDGSYAPSISADGRFVAFGSLASNLVPGDTNGRWDIFVHDRQTGTIERVSVDSAGVQGDRDSAGPFISADGRFVMLNSDATNLVPNDTNLRADVFLHDRQTGSTECLSVDSAGVPGNDASGSSAISPDGRFIAFVSSATNLVSGDTNGFWDVFVRDRQTGTTELVSVDSAGVQGDGNSGLDYNRWMISADGRFVVFPSEATNLVSSDTNGWVDVFVRDRQAGTTERVSVSSAGTQASEGSDAPAISADGRFVAFESSASDLVPGDTNGGIDVFLHDRQTATTTRMSVTSSGAEGSSSSASPAISADGRFVAFESIATLVNGDTNGYYDIFVRGPYLTLEADPQSPSAGATLAFTTWTGGAFGLNLLVVSDVNGTPTFIPVAFGSFDAAGVWTLSGTVPPGLSGNEIVFETFGFVPTGKVDASNPVAVSFQ